MKTTSYRAWAKNPNTNQAITTDYLRRSAAISKANAVPTAGYANDP